MLTEEIFDPFWAILIALRPPSKIWKGENGLKTSIKNLRRGTLPITYPMCISIHWENWHAK